MLHSKTFYHVYQPIYHLSEWRIIGFESFLRSEFYLNPVQIFQLARKTNILYEMDTGSIFKSISEFFEQFRMSNRLLFVNIFPSTLLNPAFPTFLEQLSKRIKIPQQQIVFEINEAESIEDIRPLLEMVTHLRNCDFLIAVDDVGKGDSAIQKIIELDPDFIKLDKYFSVNLSRSNKKQQLIQLFLDFSKEKSQIILEGVENAEELAIAKTLGISMAQGYFLGKPLKIQSLRRVIAYE